MYTYLGIYHTVHTYILILYDIVFLDMLYIKINLQLGTSSLEMLYHLLCRCIPALHDRSISRASSITACDIRRRSKPVRGLIYMSLVSG